MDLLLDMPRFLREDVRGWIRTFEMTLGGMQGTYARAKYGTWGEYNGETWSYGGEERVFGRMCERVPGHLPGCREVVWNVDAGFAHAYLRTVEEVAGILLPGFDKFRRGWGKELRICRVMVPWEVYRHLYREARRREKEAFCHPGGLMEWSFTRSITAQEDGDYGQQLEYTIALGYSSYYNQGMGPRIDAETFVDHVEMARRAKFEEDMQRRTEEGQNAIMPA
ncbi:Hypothetical protein D9617_6g094400 [Elsinoe fawcettii]|nr:Hypothetical protein D9617_6g094400 [Elsinoe fawcettii]